MTGVQTCALPISVKTDIFLEPCTVNEIKESSVNISDLGRNMRVIVQYEYVSPIPITPEWLERFGFKKHLAFEKRIDEKNSIAYSVPNTLTSIYTMGALVQFCHIKYVHQLQNLFYALTGGELTLKTESK